MARDVVDRIQEAWRRELPDAPVGPIGVLTRIRLIAKLLDDDHRRTMAALGIDAATRDLLSSLRRSGPPYRATPSELARSTLISAGAVSQRVARAPWSGGMKVPAKGAVGQFKMRGRRREVVGGAQPTFVACFEVRGACGWGWC